MRPQGTCTSIWDLSLCVPASTLSHVGSKNNERWLRTIDHISKLPNVFNVYFCRNIEGLAPNVIRLCIDWTDRSAMRNLHESLKVSQDSVNPLRVFVHEGAPLLSRPFAEQTTMFESYGSLLPISIHSLIARPPHPALCEMIIIHYDSHGLEYLGGDRGWKFDELFSLGLAGIQDSLGISKYQSSDDETNLPPIKHWRLLWGNEWGPIEHHSYDMLFIICIEWQSQEARATFLQRDDVRAILRKHGMPDEHSDDDYGTIGAKEYEDELSAFLMANEAIKCQRSLCDVTQIEATQSWRPTSSAQRLGCIIL